MDRKKIISKLDRLKRSHVDLWNELSSLEDEILDYRPEGDKWSILDIMQHLYLSESLSLQYIKKKSLAPEKLTKPSIWSRFQERIIIPFLKYAPAYKAPTLVSRKGFKDEYSLPEAEESFSLLHEELGEQIQGYPDAVIQNNVYRHPVMGRVRLNGMMNFHIYHFERHRKQIGRNISTYEKR